MNGSCNKIKSSKERRNYIIFNANLAYHFHQHTNSIEIQNKKSDRYKIFSALQSGFSNSYGLWLFKNNCLLKLCQKLIL